jgi:predicted lipid-binding transport protein (Tim44 family)
VPLSEEELRLLEQMERALIAEDPKLASTMRGTTLRATARRRALLGAGVFVVGVGVLMTGAVLQQTIVGIIGFVVMLASAYVAVSAWRGQNQAAADTPATSESGTRPSLSVVEGGRKSKRTPKQPRAARQHHSLMERFEERWRRRRDQNGY